MSQDEDTQPHRRQRHYSDAAEIPRFDMKSNVSRNINHGKLQNNGVIMGEVVNIELGKDTGTEEERHYLGIMYLTSPLHDKNQIEGALAGGAPPNDLYSWVLDSDDFSRWRHRCGSLSDDDEVVDLVWITGHTRQMRSLLLCGLLNDIPVKSPSRSGKGRAFFFFCDRYNDSANNATAVLRGLIYTLADQERPLISCIAKHLGGADRQTLERRDSWQILCTIFAAMMQSLEGVDGDAKSDNLVFLAVDAIDECDTDRDKLLELIAKYGGAAHIRWLLTSRRNLGIGRGLGFGADDKVGQRHGLEVYANSCPLEARQAFSLLETKRCQRTVQNLAHMSLRQSDPYRRALAAAIVASRPLNVREWCVLSGMKYCGDKCHMGSCSDKCEVQDARRRLGAFLVVEDDAICIASEPAQNFLLQHHGATLFDDPSFRTEHYRIFMRSLEIMNKTLCRNIFGLSGPGSETATIDSGQDSTPAVDSGLVGARAYACEYWVRHLLKSGQGGGDSIATFLGGNLLFWLEHICVMGSIERAVESWAQLVRFLQSNQPIDAITPLAVEVHRFMMRNVEIISEYPLQIYESALVFSQQHQDALQGLLRKHRPEWVTLSTPEAEEEQQTQTLSHSQGCEVNKLIFSPDGTMVAAVMDGLRTIKVWDLVTGGRLLWILDHKSRVSWVAFNPQKLQTMATADGRMVRLWDLAKKEQVAPAPLGLTPPSASIGAFSPDGQLLALASGQPDSHICLWDQGTGEEPTVFQQSCGYPEPAHSLAFSTDGAKLISAHVDYTIRLWDVVSHVCVRTIPSGHVSSIVAPAPPASQGNSVSAASAVWANDDEITRWDLRADQTIRRIPLPRGDDTGLDLFRMLVLAPNGDSFAMAMGNEVETWKIVDGHTHRHSVMKIGSTIHALAISADSTTMAIACFAGIFLWGLGGDSQHARVMLDHAGSVDLLRVSGGGDETPKLLVSASMSAGDIKVQHLNSPDGKGTWLQLNDPSGGAAAELIDVAVSPDGTRLLCISDGQPAAVWNLQTFQRDHVIPSRGLSLAAAWIPPPNGNRVAVLLTTGAISLWDVKKRAQVRLYPQRGGGSLERRSDGGCIAVAPSGKRMATSFRSVIELWNPDAPGGKRVRYWGDQATASALRFAEPRSRDRGKDVNQLAVLYHGGDIKIWDVENGSCLRTMVSTRVGATELVAFRPGVCGVMTNAGPAADTSACRDYGVDMDAGWIMKGSERVLWLPADCRPRSVLVVPGKAGAVSTIVLGCWTGRVLVLNLSAQG